MKENIVLDKSVDFALGIITIYKYLIYEKKEYVLSKQLLRAGTSIGANITESQNAVSKADFKNKLSIALKEADETAYWIELLVKSNFCTENSVYDLRYECKEICKILTSIIKNS